MITTYYDTGLAVNTEYCYTISAYDGAGNGSEQTNQVCQSTQNSQITGLITLPDTGQTTSYTSTYGEDADYSIMPLSYTDNGDGTVLDNVTGLLWQKDDSNNASTPSTGSSYCDNLSLGQYSDWRMPSLLELLSIVNYENPRLSVFTIEEYWTSSMSGYDNWSVDLAYGNAKPYNYFSVDPLNPYNIISHYLSVKCVRGDEFPSQSFTDNGNGIITDTVTGLMWPKNVSATEVNWESAISYCEGLSLGEYTDWRLPNIKELASLVDANKKMDSSYFSSSTGYYWSSTTAHDDSTYAWRVMNRGSGGLLYLVCRYGQNGGLIDDCSDIGTDLLKTNNYHVQCVRGGLE